MDEVGVLLTTAEIAIAVSGFASLASILGRRFSRDDPQVDAARLRNMLEISLSTAGLALLPIFFMALGATDAAVWRLASLAFVATLSTIAWSVRRRNRVLVRTGAAYSRSFNATAFGAAGLLGLALLANGVAFEGRLLFATYFGALLVNLTFAGLLFVRIISSLLAAAGHE